MMSMSHRTGILKKYVKFQKTFDLIVLNNWLIFVERFLFGIAPGVLDSYIHLK